MRPTCRNELIKAGVSLSDLLLVGVCTMQWLSHYVLGTSHDLLTAAASSERWRMHIQRPRSVPHRSRWPPTRPSGGTQHPKPLAGLEGYDCDACREAQNEAAEARLRRRAQSRLPVELRHQLLAAIYAGRPFRAVLSDLGLTSNQVWGLMRNGPVRSTLP